MQVSKVLLPIIFSRGMILIPIAVISVLLIISRRPDAVYFPQLFAEDGVVWLKHAYEEGGLGLLLRPQDDYLQTLSRIVAYLAVHFPLKYTPHIFNSVAIAIQALPVVLLFSKRFDHVVRDTRSKILLAFLYLGMPNTIEIHANLSYAQWRLALAFFILVLSSAPVSFVGRAVDIFVAILSSLSGPYSIFLFPVSFLYLRRRKDSWRIVLTSCAGVGAIIQGTIATFFQSGDRARGSLGASVEGLCQMISGQLSISSTVGIWYYRVARSEGILDDFFCCILSLFTILFLVHAAVRGSAELRALVILASLLLVAALITPNSSGYNDLWSSMLRPGAAARYWFFPAIALFCSSVSLLFESSRMSKVIAWAVLASMLFGAVISWRLPAWKRLHYPEASDRFELAQSGAVIEFPIHPLGYKMMLVKK